MSALAAQPVNPGPFEKPRKPYAVGGLYSRTWTAPFVHGVTETWAARCRGYWERVEQRFGLILSDHRNAYDEATGTITTFATVLMILPGERYVAGEHSKARH